MGAYSYQVKVSFMSYICSKFVEELPELYISISYLGQRPFISIHSVQKLQKKFCIFLFLVMRLKTLLNIVEARFNFFFTLMSVLYDDVQMDQ